jgi:RND family efflux transporter MFP subunit
MSSGGSRRSILVGAAVVAVLAAAVAAILWSGSAPVGGTPEGGRSAAKAPRYHCPMHPTVVSDRPGDCPICGMRLVPVEEDEPAAGGEGAGGAHAGHAAPEAAGAAAGRVTVKVSETKRQLIGVKTAPVERRPLVRTIRTVGRVAYDETRLHHVHTKIGGWLERLHANATGEQVTAGDPLLTIYSPELLASGQEFLLALRARERLAGTTLPSIRESGEDLVASARRRLLLFDLTPDQIEALERDRIVPRTMTLHAPISGHVVARNVTQGERIEPGVNLLDIADLRRVWVLADVYEYELPFVRQGQAATMTLSYLPGRAFEGRITLVYPVLAEMTRTVKVRLEFPNPDLALKPEMYAEVEIGSDLGERLVVPDSAVISTGERDVVFVDRGEGFFEPREIRLGVRLPDTFEVLEGVAEGEEVLVSGNFFVDSESKLKAALAAAGAGNAAAGSGESPPGHRH